MQKHDASKEIERLQSIVNVKDACIKNYTSYIKELKDKFKGENEALCHRVAELHSHVQALRGKIVAYERGMPQPVGADGRSPRPQLAGVRELGGVSSGVGDLVTPEPSMSDSMCSSRQRPVRDVATETMMEKGESRGGIDFETHTKVVLENATLTKQLSESQEEAKELARKYERLVRSFETGRKSPLEVEEELGKMQTALLAANTHRHDVEVRAIEMENRNNDLKQQLQRLTDLGRELSGELHQTKQKYSANQETMKKMFAERDADKQMVNEKMNEILRLREHLNPHLLAMDSFKAREAELGG